MSDDFGKKPFTLVDVKIVRGAIVVDLPSSRKLKFKERTKSAEFIGDSSLQAVATVAEGVEWELEQGGIPLKAYALMTNRTLDTAGSTPNQTATLTAEGAQAFPYFTIYGKVLGDGGDDIHCKIFKSKITDALEGEFGYGEFMASTIKGLGVANEDNKVYEFVANETATALPAETESVPAFTMTSVPVDGATGVSVSANQVLTFSNALAPHEEDRILLTSAAGTLVACAVTIDAERKLVTLNPNSNLSGTTDYLLIVPSVKDVYDQALTNTVINFTTA